MAEFRENGAEETEVLKWILSQSHRARKKKAQLVRRLATIRAESDAPVHSKSFSSMPKSRLENKDGIADTVIKISEIEDRILQQQRDVEGAIIEVMNLLEILPEKSLEREICELYHIDDMAWKDIQEEIPMSRSQCYKRYNNALDIMLSDQRVRDAVAGSMEEYRAYKRLENQARKKKGTQSKTGGKARGKGRRA